MRERPRPTAHQPLRATHDAAGGRGSAGGGYAHMRTGVPGGAARGLDRFVCVCDCVCMCVCSLAGPLCGLSFLSFFFWLGSGVADVHACLCGWVAGWSLIVFFFAAGL